MKLRIKGDSIRLRLTQSETRNFGEGLPVRETTSFPHGEPFSYALEPSGDAGEITAAFTGRSLLVQVPQGLARSWAGGTAVALQAKLPLQRGKELFLLIEKDFQCLKPRAHQPEDESDLFPNPNERHGHCT